MPPLPAADDYRLRKEKEPIRQGVDLCGLRFEGDAMKRKDVRGFARSCDFLTEEVCRIREAVSRHKAKGPIPAIIGRKLEDAETMLSDASYYLNELASLKK